MANYLKKQGFDTTQKVTDFMITKWNAIAKVFGNEKKVGVRFYIHLKKVEVWWRNPDFYRPVQQNQNMGKHLSVFCNNTKRDNADHRMLYTHGVGGRVAGMAWVGQICQARHSCSVVRSKKRGSVSTELHELGHNLGFLHDPQMKCSTPYGFMGWKFSTFKDCYRERLLKKIKKKSFNCLRQRNVRRPKLNKG
ncbi:Zinc metalloproteinase/disintegrin [Plakobranchus ocellatus]|uniref:Zinc metalloproteinase/disintegrin n=1 Tax=Plakobranchus ocellatus TaxID=259542 RepID=A0AAV3Y1Y4_9GAST|nr:Zinc metalloproteinase/disintegrin [Plakobranchus ocellatus]